MVGIKWIVLLFLNVTFSYSQDPIAPPEVPLIWALGVLIPK